MRAQLVHAAGQKSATTLCTHSDRSAYSQVGRRCGGVAVLLYVQHSLLTFMAACTLLRMLATKRCNVRKYVPDLMTKASLLLMLSVVFFTFFCTILTL